MTDDRGPSSGAPYRDAAWEYRAAGWASPIPLPPGQKTPPPAGYTGWAGVVPSGADIQEWIYSDVTARGNIGLHLSNDELYGLDVDNYDAKPGGASLATLTERAGTPLPPTWMSTSRDDGVSGIRLFRARLPEGRVWLDKPGEAIESVHRGHRYVVVAPSVHPDTGRKYRMIGPDGHPSVEPPRVDGLPWLPSEWIEILSKPGQVVTGSAATYGQTREAIEGFRPGEPCEIVAAVNATALRALAQAQSRSLHPTALADIWQLVRLGFEGHRGVRESLLRHAEAFLHARGDIRREGREVALAEWQRMAAGGVGKSVALPREEKCHCEVVTINLSGFPPNPGEAAGSAVLDLAAIDWSDGWVAPSRAQATGRDDLNVTNPALAAEWLRDNVGTGRLSGVFKRGDASHLVHTPGIGESGYLMPDEGDDGFAQVRPIGAAELAARVQFTWSCFREKRAKQDPDAEDLFLSEDGSGETVTRSAAMFPIEAARVVCSAPDMLPRVRRLRGVVHAPIIRSDGSIVEQPGYDVQSKILYMPPPDLVVPPVPADPTPEQIGQALELLGEMIQGFPFVTVHDRAAYLGALLTPLLRELAPSPYKMIAINAHQAGSGKTLLATLARIIHGGVMRAEMPEDDAELRKQVTTILDTTTGPVVHIDNVTGVLRSSTLAGLLTSPVWDDRKLGVNELARCINDRLWIITGNNVTLGGDLVRRTVWVAIDPGMPDPQNRTDFAINDLENWTREHRGELLHALLTLVRAWVAAGRPGDAKTSDGYSGWLRAVNGILAVAGVDGRFDAPEARQQGEGAEDADWSEFLAAVHASFGEVPFTVRDLVNKISSVTTLSIDGTATVAGVPLDALPAELAEKASRSGVSMIGKTLGRWLANRAGRWAGGRMVEKSHLDRTKTQVWRIRQYGV